MVKFWIFTLFSTLLVSPQVKASKAEAVILGKIQKQLNTLPEGKRTAEDIKLLLAGKKDFIPVPEGSSPEKSKANEQYPRELTFQVSPDDDGTTYPTALDAKFLSSFIGPEYFLGFNANRDLWDRPKDLPKKVIKEHEAQLLIKSRRARRYVFAQFDAIDGVRAPKVKLANQKECLVCHTGSVPIYPREPWNGSGGAIPGLVIDTQIRQAARWQQVQNMCGELCKTLECRRELLRLALTRENFPLGAPESYVPNITNVFRSLREQTPDTAELRDAQKKFLINIKALGAYKAVLEASKSFQRIPSRPKDIDTIVAANLRALRNHSPDAHLKVADLLKWIEQLTKELESVYPKDEFAYSSTVLADKRRVKVKSTPQGPKEEAVFFFFEEITDKNKFLQVIPDVVEPLLGDVPMVDRIRPYVLGKKPILDLTFEDNLAALHLVRGPRIDVGIKFVGKKNDTVGATTPLGQPEIPRPLVNGIPKEMAPNFLAFHGYHCFDLSRKDLIKWSDRDIKKFLETEGLADLLKVGFPGPEVLEEAFATKDFKPTADHLEDAKFISLEKPDEELAPETPRYAQIFKKHCSECHFPRARESMRLPFDDIAALSKHETTSGNPVLEYILGKNEDLRMPPLRAKSPQLSEDDRNYLVNEMKKAKR